MRITQFCACVIAGLAATSATAHAQATNVLGMPFVEDDASCHTDIEVPLLALSLNGLAIQVERPLVDRASVMVAIALRDGADGDFQATTLAIGSELRFWLKGAHRRWFVAPRVELGFTHVAAAQPKRTLGNAVMGTVGAVIGYRFLLWQHLTIVPEIGIAGRADFVSHVPDRATWTPQIGVALGWRIQ
jgi:Protein of unknown function (DUF3575)